MDDTSDVAKPVSIATQTALDFKARLARPTFSGKLGGVRKAMVGLGSVDNTSDVAKPISIATQTAFDEKRHKFTQGVPPVTNAVRLFDAGTTILRGIRCAAPQSVATTAVI